MEDDRSTRTPATQADPAVRIREDFSPDLSPAPPTHASSTDKLGYLRSGLAYLNPPSPLAQLDGADDSELLSPAAGQPIATFQTAGASCPGPPPATDGIKGYKIDCDYCKQEFASCSAFNNHTIQCAQQWAKAQRLRRNEK
jgi:hypothetical protein